MIYRLIRLLRTLCVPFLSIEEWKQFGKLSFPNKDTNTNEWSDYKHILTKHGRQLVRQFVVRMVTYYIATLMSAVAAFLVLGPLYRKAQLIENESIGLILSVTTIIAGAMITLNAVYLYLMSGLMLKSLWFALAVGETMNNLPDDVTRNDFTSVSKSQLEKLLVPTNLNHWLDDAPEILASLTLTRQ